ncbi:hypothetical protein [Neorhizobium vignae]|uniref:hypothetical protein n=1 Tax=Neorhizobium vignae TaxID=690585 RepID=UPI000B222A06|nr:hypothetical protein [Neorhizobium vignae]
MFDPPGGLRRYEVCQPDGSEGEQQAEALDAAEVEIEASKAMAGDIFFVNGDEVGGDLGMWRLPIRSIRRGSAQPSPRVVNGVWR